MILAEFSQGTVLHALEIVPYSNVKYVLIFHGRWAEILVSCGCSVFWAVPCSKNCVIPSLGLTYSDEVVISVNAYVQGNVSYNKILGDKGQINHFKALTNE